MDCKINFKNHFSILWCFISSLVFIGFVIASFCPEIFISCSVDFYKYLWLNKQINSCGLFFDFVKELIILYFTYLIVEYIFNKETNRINLLDKDNLRSKITSLLVEIKSNLIRLKHVKKVTNSSKFLASYCYFNSNIAISFFEDTNTFKYIKSGEFINILSNYIDINRAMNLYVSDSSVDKESDDVLGMLIEMVRYYHYLLMFVLIVYSKNYDFTKKFEIDLDFLNTCSKSIPKEIKTIRNLNSFFLNSSKNLRKIDPRDLTSTLSEFNKAFKELTI